MYAIAKHFMTYKSIFLFTFFVCIALATTAQNRKWAISIIPTSLIEIHEAGPVVGVDYRLSDKYAIRLDAGAILYNPVRGEKIGGNSSGSYGFKIKPAFRYYFKGAKDVDGFYAEAEAYLKQVNYYYDSPLSLVDANGNFAYDYLGGYTTVKNVFGLNMILGVRTSLSNNERFGLDGYFGLGSRTRKLKQKIFDLPSGVFAPVPLPNQISGLFDARWDEGTNLNFPLGLRLYYKL